MLEILFKNLESLEFLIPEVVLDEFKNDERKKLIISKYKESIVPTISEIQKIQKKIVSKYPLLINSRFTKNNADPFVIATAMFYETKVLSMEKISKKEVENLGKTPQKTLRKIPHICMNEGIICHNFEIFLAQP